MWSQAFSLECACTSLCIPLRVLLALLRHRLFPDLLTLSVLQPLERIRNVVVVVNRCHLLDGDRRGRLGYRSLHDLPPRFGFVVVVVRAVAVTHVVEAEVLDFVGGLAVAAVGAVLFQVEVGVVEAEQVLLL